MGDVKGSRSLKGRLFRPRRAPIVFLDPGDERRQLREQIRHQHTNSTFSVRIPHQRHNQRRRLHCLCGGLESFSQSVRQSACERVLGIKPSRDIQFAKHQRAGCARPEFGLSRVPGGSCWSYPTKVDPQASVISNEIRYQDDPAGQCRRCHRVCVYEVRIFKRSRIRSALGTSIGQHRE